jgi:hypothetical protein
MLAISEIRLLQAKDTMYFYFAKKEKIWKQLTRFFRSILFMVLFRNFGGNTALTGKSKRG